MGYFFAGQVLDELFLTLAPQIARRDGVFDRPGLVMGKRFAPENPLWGTLVSVKRGESHLFLRYAFETKEVTICPIPYLNSKHLGKGSGSIIVTGETCSRVGSGPCCMKMAL